MLIEFKVKNFKSFRDEQTFSMVADKDTTFWDTHVVEGNGTVPDLVKTAIICGPNASGKSNFLEAMRTMFMCIIIAKAGAYIDKESIDKRILDSSPLLQIEPYKLSDAVRDVPTEMEITFADGGIRYQYGFSYLEREIVEEWLYVYATAKPQKWFHRLLNKDKNEYKYEFSSYLKGQKDAWKKLTNTTSLFLNVAANYNSEQLEKIRDLIPYNLSCAFVSDDTEFDLASLMENEARKERILKFIKAADPSIIDIIEEKHKEPSKYLDRWGVHEGEQKEKVRLPWHEESAGTQRMYILAFYVLHALDLGMTLIIDEFDTSLHYVLVKHIIELFNSSENTNGAQLIFTTHNALLLDTMLMRRDQFWFVEKEGGASTLFPLTDFSPRKNEKIWSRYISGAYGAVPFLQRFEINEACQDGSE